MDNQERNLEANFTPRALKTPSPEKNHEDSREEETSHDSGSGSSSPEQIRESNLIENNNNENPPVEAPGIDLIGDLIGTLMLLFNLANF